MSPDLKPSVLIIDDDMGIRHMVEEYLDKKGLKVFTAGTGEEGLRRCERTNVDIIILDQMLPDCKGWRLCPALRKHNDHAKIIFVTAYPSFENAVKAIRSGAYDYLSKPFQLEELGLVVDRALEARELDRLAKLERYRSGKEKEKSVLIGADGGLAESHALIDVAASSDAPVLITGETGSGKNVAALTIHHRSAGRNGGFVSVNCAALPEHLFEAELFGYDKGAFTGASSSKRGLIEMAEQGTLLLDEIGAMALNLQSKLLGVLEESRIRRVGGVSFRPVDIRIMASTNRRIEEAVEEGSFRDDLYYRLNVIRIHLPPLRDRKEDIPQLCAHFLKKFSANRSLLIPDHEMGRLKAYDWPGNVRELRNVVERAVLLRKDDQIRPSHYLGTPVRRSPVPGDVVAQYGFGEERTLQDIEKDHIREVLRKAGGNYTQTARILGISLSTLRRRIEQYGLSRLDQ